MNIEEEALTLVFLHKGVYKKKKEFAINFLYNVAHA